MWTFFSWLKIGSGGGLLWTRWWTLGVPQRAEFARCSLLGLLVMKLCASFQIWRLLTLSTENVFRGRRPPRRKELPCRLCTAYALISDMDLLVSPNTAAKHCRIYLKSKFTFVFSEDKGVCCEYWADDLDLPQGIPLCLYRQLQEEFIVWKGWVIR